MGYEKKKEYHKYNHMQQNRGAKEENFNNLSNNFPIQK